MSIFRRKRRQAAKAAVKKAGKVNTKSDAFQIVAAIKHMRESGAMKINYNTYEVKVIRALFWDDRSEEFHHNFISRLHAYLDGMTGKDPDAEDYTPITLTLRDLESNDILDSYTPN